MRFFHLSDLHIGKRVNGFSMLEDQRHILRQIVDLAILHRPDGILIAGDLYDKSVPPAEAVGVLDAFFTTVVQAGIPVFAISGNHDSPERLGFASTLLEDTGVHLAAQWTPGKRPVILEDAYGEVAVYLLPYLRPALVRHFCQDSEVMSHQEAVAWALAQWKLDPKRRNILVAHQFVAGGVTCDSEERSVGGTDQVSSALFSAFDYVALGHLHGPQSIGKGSLRYSGSPLKYSISEWQQEKSVTLLTLAEKGSLTVETLPLEPLRDLREITGTYEEVTARAFYLGSNTKDYLHVVLTDPQDIPEAVGRLRAIYPNLMKLSYAGRSPAENSGVLQAEMDTRSPLELFQDLYQQQNGCPMDPCQADYLKHLMETIWEETP